MMMQQPMMQQQVVMQPGMQTTTTVMQQPGMGGMMGMQQPVMMMQKPAIPAGGATAVLAGLTGLYITQRGSPLEAMTGIELPHKFAFFPLDGSGAPGNNRIFRGNEMSDPIVDQFMKPDERPFNMFITMTNGPMDIYNCMYFQRPSAFCQCDNGELRVFSLEGGAGRQVGVVRGPCTWCMYELNIFDAANNLRYMITGTPCQPGVICGPRCPCGSCNVSTFNILDAAFQPVATFQRTTGFCSQLWAQNDNYILNFPASATVEDKMLLMGAIVMFDFAYFEKPTGQEQNQQIGY